MTLLRSSLRISGGGLPDLFIAIGAGAIASGGIAALALWIRGWDDSMVRGSPASSSVTRRPMTAAEPAAVGAGRSAWDGFMRAAKQMVRRGGSPSLQALLRR